MRYYWTDERYQITYSKRVTHAVKMVDSCSRENGVLCTVARSWLLFLHDESEWKNFESNIAWGVDELHQTFWFEQFFNGKLCCKIHDLLSVPIIFFWIGLLGAISRWTWLKLTMDDFVHVFDAWKKWSCGFVCVWSSTNWFCYLEWMIHGGKLIWCDLLTLKIYQVEGTILALVRIFVNKINTYRLNR